MEAKEIIGINGCKILVDLDEYHKLKNHKWSVNKNGYASANINKKRVRINRYIMDCPEGMVVDHINHNPLDNRKSNLRIITQKQNLQNRRKLKEKSSIYKGVHWSKHAKSWRVQIRHENKLKQIGYFKDELQAVRAYNDKALELFGEYACINKLPE